MLGKLKVSDFIPDDLAADLDRKNLFCDFPLYKEHDSGSAYIIHESFPII